MAKDLLYNRLLKPLLFHLDPESAHHFAVTALSLADKIPFFFPLLEQGLNCNSKELNQTVAGLSFPNPIGMAAGFDKTAELYPMLSYMGFGAIEVGTITAKAQPGNEKPRLFRFPDQNALVNRMGFNNPGADLAHQTIQSQKKKAIRGINAGKSKVTPIEEAAQDYAYTFSKLLPFADYAVINVSSPNTPGLRSLQSSKVLEQLIKDIKLALGGLFPVPFFLKFAPDLALEELIEGLDICLQFQISGVILTNTTLDKSSLSLSNPPEGGLSGDPLFDKSLYFVQKAFSHLGGRIPIIGVGGISSGERAIRMIRSGANLLQIYTSYIYKGPFLPRDLNMALVQELKRTKNSVLSSLVGLDS